MMTKDWTDIASLHSMYKNGATKPSEVVEWYLERIEKLNSKLNVYLTVTVKEARLRAQELDSQIADLDSMPLFGIPIALKDLYMTKGIKTTAGSKVLEKHVALYDATVVKKYYQAGAILLGKLNCDAWAHGSSGENSDFGSSKNPWNLDYVPGGSSSGSAAAVAADLCMVAGGTDTGGSIRCPASFCGVVGLKPTYGRVSRYGVVAMASSLDSIGHLTGNVRDAARVLAVTAGVDTHDATSSPRVLEAAIERKDLQGVRIGIPEEYQATDTEVKNANQQALDKLVELGATLIPVSLPHTALALPTYYIVQPAEVSSNLGRYDGIRYGAGREVFGAEAKRRIMLGTYTLSSGYYDAYYNTAQKVRSLIIEDFAKVFMQVDVLASPVIPHLPFKIGEKSADPLALYLEDVLTVPVNLAGLPALALPCGLSESKLPIGFQLIGPQFSEAKLFSIADVYQHNTNWHEARPSL